MADRRQGAARRRALGERVSEPRVVAELGRPETPDETAERKARERALRRSRQTTRNLVASLAATLGVVVLIVLIVPRGGPVSQPAVDVADAAAGQEATAGQALLAPDLPSAWKANAAELRGSGDDAAWYVGWVIGANGYAGLSEGLPGTDDLLDTALDHADPTGTATLQGTPWRVFDRRSLGGDAGNVAYGLSTRLGQVRLAVYGTDARQVRALAAAAVRDARDRGLDGTAALP